MTAEEFLVERYLSLEKKVAELEEVIEDKEELIEQKKDEICEYENLVKTLSKYMKVSEISVNFYLCKNIAEDMEDIDFLREFFELGEETAENE
jgi:hypothetical protein